MDIYYLMMNSLDVTARSSPIQKFTASGILPEYNNINI